MDARAPRVTRFIGSGEPTQSLTMQPVKMSTFVNIREYKTGQKAYKSIEKWID